MTKRSAMVLAIGIAVALMATAFALSTTSRPSASARTEGRRQAAQVKPLVRTTTRKVKVHKTKEVAVYVSDPATDPNSVQGQDSTGSSDDVSSDVSNDPSEDPLESDDDELETEDDTEDEGSGSGTEEEDDSGSDSSSTDD